MLHNTVELYSLYRVDSTKGSRVVGIIMTVI